MWIFSLIDALLYLETTFISLCSWIWVKNTIRNLLGSDRYLFFLIKTLRIQIFLSQKYYFHYILY